MSGEAKIKALYPESFIANKYSKDPFRMIGLIDVDINFKGDIERVTLAYYRSSGTNNGKIKGLWYPIVGIKLYTGKILRAFYENGKYISSYALTPSRFNEIIYSKNVYDNNKNSQRKNFEKIIRDIV